MWLLLVAAACGGPKLRLDEPTSPPALDDAAAARMLADVRWLADDAREGRGTGAPGDAAAVEYIEQRMRALGLEPGGDAGYRQTFTVTIGTETVASATYARLGEGVPLRLGEDYRPSLGSSPGEALGRPVFVDFGIVAPALGRDDYAGKDVHGFIVVVKHGAPENDDPHAAIGDFGDDRYKIRTAREHGAIGVVLVGDRDPGAMRSGAVVDMGLPAIDLLHVDPDSVVSKDLAFRVALHPIRAESQNVVGLLRGADPRLKDEVVVVGAHHDHLGRGPSPSSRAPDSTGIHNGADDNASGTSLVLEVARQMKEGPPPKRTVAFVLFGAEELGVLGSRHFVEDRPAGLSHIVAMINADMVGRMRDDHLVFEGSETSSAWAPLLLSSAEGLGMRIDTTADGFGASDHTSFYAAGIPIANLFTGVHDQYHTPDDDADLIDADGMRRIATFALRFLRGVADRAETPDYVRPDPHEHGEATRGGFRASLGTIPDYGADVRGVKLSGVRPGSPAERAGVRAGDVVVGLAGHDITNIYDYTYMLREIEPGVTVPMIVERGGRRVTLEVTPAPGR